MNLEEKLYTSTEVAQILGVSLRSVYRYLEENKLDAEVKTATGRHRFTKQNILDFLYPNKDNSKASIEPEQAVTKSLPKTKQVEDIVKKEKAPVKEESPEDEAEAEPVDWLAKFREAASKFKTEETVETTVVEEQIQPKKSKETLTDLGDFAFAPKEQEVGVKRYFYRSMLGGLKDIAQNIDKSARKASVDYAFTLNAGLSLHKPIKPFSVLHVYIKSQDKELFEKMLQLVPSESETSQVCLALSDKEAIYENRKELHGLFVVSNNQLKEDLIEAGDDELAKELEQDFPF